LTLHWYPGSSHDSEPGKEDLQPERLDWFSLAFKRFMRPIEAGWSGEVWAGETASLQNGGADGVSNAFQSTTWLYDQLGQQGEIGIHRLFQESLSMSRYAILNASDHYSPYPDFFSTLLWRQVVGSGVLKVVRPNGRNNTGEALRFYARCARGNTGDVVMVIVNLSPDSPASVNIHGGDVGSTKQEWLLTAPVYPHGNASDWASSKTVALNGLTLRLTATGAAPALTSQKTPMKAPVSIAPLSVGLVQFHPATGSACLDIVI
jgi:hypothetical protein